MQIFIKSVERLNSPVYSAPPCTLKNILVHPKDRIGDEEKLDVTCKTPCMNCDHVYVGETG